MQPKHSAIVAGLTLALSFGTVAAPVTAVAEEPTPGVASDATDIDKGLYTQQSFSGVLRSVQGVSFVNVTAEMKYFTKYESHGNYNQGFSYDDGNTPSFSLIRTVTRISDVEIILMFTPSL